MKCGALIFAHNNRDVDYALMSVISAGIVKKNLKVPVSLVSDTSTIEWMKTSNIYDKAVEVFDQIIQVEKPITDNYRKLHDGVSQKTVPFVNSNRASAYDLTPYDRTLLLDSDFLIFSDRLNAFWNVDEDILIAESMLDFYDQTRMGYHDRYISDTGIHMFWATTVMFSKNENSKRFFGLVNYIRENYQYYGDLFRFDTRQYRNDIAFSVANHILYGFETDKKISLPRLLTAIDKDVLHSVDDTGKLIFLINTNLNNKFCAAAINGIDVHIMNKESIVRNAESLLRLI
jgi:hypothetical protein